MARSLRHPKKKRMKPVRYGWFVHRGGTLKKDKPFKGVSRRHRIAARRAAQAAERAKRAA